MMNILNFLSNHQTKYHRRVQPFPCSSTIKSKPFQTFFPSHATPGVHFYVLWGLFGGRLCGVIIGFKITQWGSKCYINKLFTIPYHIVCFLTFHGFVCVGVITHSQLPNRFITLKLASARIYYRMKNRPHFAICGPTLHSDSVVFCRVRRWHSQSWGPEYGLLVSFYIYTDECVTGLSTFASLIYLIAISSLVFVHVVSA